jgi:hypothetical protein
MANMGDCLTGRSAESLRAEAEVVGWREHVAGAHGALGDAVALKDAVRELSRRFGNPPELNGAIVKCDERLEEKRQKLAHCEEKLRWAEHVWKQNSGS